MHLHTHMHTHTFTCFSLWCGVCTYMHAGQLAESCGRRGMPCSVISLFIFLRQALSLTLTGSQQTRAPPVSTSSGTCMAGACTVMSIFSQGDLNPDPHACDVSTLTHPPAPVPCPIFKLTGKEKIVSPSLHPGYAKPTSSLLFLISKLTIANKNKHLGCIMEANLILLFFFSTPSYYWGFGMSGKKI